MNGLKASTRILIASIITGICLCAVDAIIDVTFFSNESLLEELLSPSLFEIYVRAAILTIMVANGLIASRIAARLENANEEIKVLRGIIPICSVCKNIRDDAGAWHNVADYMRAHSEAKFSHGYCSTCADEKIKEIENVGPDTP